MSTPRTTIRRKLILAIMLTSTTALLLTGALLIAREAFSLRSLLARELETRAGILAANSTAALAFRNPEDARQILSGLRSDPSVVAAALYDEQGRLFAIYPEGAATTTVPAVPGAPGHRIEKAHLVVYQRVVETGNQLGTLYIKTDLRELNHGVRVHSAVVLLAVLMSIGVAFGLSTWLQRRIAKPVRVLADAARAVSERKDFSIRAETDSDDEIGLLAGAFNDMLAEIQQRDTALQTSEERLRAILETALDAIVTMDHRGKILEFNPAAEKLFGRTRERAIGEDLAEVLIPAGLREQHRHGLARYLSTREGVVLDRRLELNAQREGGEEFPVEVSITRISQEEPPMFTGFIRDISDRKQAEREIRKLNADLEKRVAARTAELETSNRELEAFSYSVSHDLRAPLRAIDGFSKALLEDCGDALGETGAGHLERVRRATSQMGNLIDDLLHLARISRAELQRESVDLAAAGREIAASLTQAQPERQVTFIVPPSLTAEGDSQLLHVVLDNLLRNAWKFTSKHPTAKIELGLSGSNGEKVFFVADDGAGFDMAHADLLFAPFQRLHRQSDFEGTGVGLATVQRIIHRHGGRLWAEGSVGHGATFYFTLWEAGK